MSAAEVKVKKIGVPPSNVGGPGQGETPTTYTHASLWDADLSKRYCPHFKSHEISDDSACKIERFGQSFVWDAAVHRTAEELEPLRQIGDDLMDALLDALDPAPGDDVLELARCAASKDPNGLEARFLHSVEAVPEWVDWSLIARGQEVFCRHLPASGAVLYNMSLVGGFSAPKITKVLEQSGYLVGSPGAVMRRLFETGRLLIDSCAADGALRPGEVGWASALRVRALHAKVRRRLLRRQGQHAWDGAALGVPINQEDMAVTLLAFSYNVLMGLELVRGEPLPDDEQAAYLHLWRYIGHLLGVSPEHNPCARGVRCF